MRKRKKGLSNVKILTMSAMLTALSIVIGNFCKTFLNFGVPPGLFRITFENFPIIIAGIMFGPWVGAFVGAASDVITFLLSPQSFALLPAVTLGASLVGFVSGLVFRIGQKKVGSVKIVTSVYLAHLVGSMIVKSIGLFVYLDWLVLWRIPLYLVIAALESVIICLMMKNKNLQHFIRFKGGKNDLR